MRLSTLDALQSDPEIAGELYGLVKRKFPNAVVPDRYEVQKRAEQIAEEKIKIERERIEKIEAALSEERVLRMQQEKYNKLKSAPYYLNDDDIKEVEKLMVEEQIPKYETAAKLYRSTQSPLLPTVHGAPLRAPKGKDFRELLSDRSSDLINPSKSKSWRESQADEAWREMEAGALNQ